jgi:hypothetical protein
MLQSTAGEVASVAGHVPCRKAWDASGIPWMPQIFGWIPVQIIAKVSYLYILLVLLVQINITCVGAPIWEHLLWQWDGPQFLDL